MPFGLSNAPATFQRTMDFVLSGLKWQTCLVYLDDVVVFSKTEEDHVRALDEVFSKLRVANLKLKPSKCFLFEKGWVRVEYLLVSCCGPKQIEVRFFNVSSYGGR
eukprot:Trichotokara_eunicae@DN1903_c0_g1_i1.p1